MKIKLLLSITILIFVNAYSQVEQCGTMQNLEEQIKKDPSLKARMIEIENQNQEWEQEEQGEQLWNK